MSSYRALYSAFHKHLRPQQVRKGLEVPKKTWVGSFSRFHQICSICDRLSINKPVFFFVSVLCNVDLLVRVIYI